MGSVAECANRNTCAQKITQPQPKKIINLARRWELPFPKLISWPHLRDLSDKIILRSLFLSCSILSSSYKSATSCQACCVHILHHCLPAMPVTFLNSIHGHNDFRRQLKERGQKTLSEEKTENPFTLSPSQPCCAPRHFGVIGTDQELSLLSDKSLGGKTWNSNNPSVGKG